MTCFMISDIIHKSWIYCFINNENIFEANMFEGLQRNPNGHELDGVMC